MAALRDPEPAPRTPVGATWRCGARTCCRAWATTSCGRSRRGSSRISARGPGAGEGRRADGQRKAMMLLQGILRRAVVRGLIRIEPGAVGRQAQAAAGTAAAAAGAGDGRADPRAACSTAWSSPQPRRRRDRREQLAWWRAAQRDDRVAAGLRRPAARSRTAARAGATCGTARCTWSRARPAERATSTCSRRWRRTSRSGGCSAAVRRASALIFPTLDGDEWKRDDWQNWRRRVYRPAAIAAGVTGDLRPYRLRGRFVSLLLWEGAVADLRRRAGRALGRDAGTALRGRRCASSSTQPRMPAAEAIRAARERGLRVATRIATADGAGR